MTLVVLAGVLVFDLEDQQAIIRLASTDPASAAERLAVRYSLRQHKCETNVAPDDLDALVEALMSVEMLARGRLARALESLIIVSAMQLGLRPPDLSIGRAQIRISRAMAVFNDRKLERRHLEWRIARQLLSACGARRWARRILEKIALEQQIAMEPLDRADVELLAGHFNGQKTFPDTEGAIAHYIYRELVYHVYQTVRFRRLSAAVSPCCGSAVARFN